MKIDRLLAITIMLLNRSSITAAELADHFEVSIRTIYRDFDTLNLAGIPVCSQQGKSGGYSIMENYSISRQILSMEDLVSIITALKGISTTFGGKKIETTLEKVKSIVPGKEKDIHRRSDEEIILDMTPWGTGEKQKKILQEIYQSIQILRVMEFNYRNSRGESGTRRIEPMSLVMKGFSWYLFGYCRLRNGFRLFKISRMTGIKHSGQHFKRKADSYHDHFYPENQPRGEMVNLKLKFEEKIRFRVEDYYHEEDIKVREDGSVIVEVSFPEGVWITGYLLSFGDNVTVLEPEHIRQRIQTAAENLVKIYS